MTHFDAIIAGCGPVGAVLANLLGSQGLSVCVIEKYTEIYDKPRAITIDWEVMRVLQFCGVAHQLSPGTKPHPGTDFIGVDGKLIKLFDPLPAPYALSWPATLTFIQPELEKLLRTALTARPSVNVKMGWSVGQFMQLKDHVCVEMVEGGTGRSKSLNCDFLIGCDGASSDVRQALGLGLEDYGFDEWWVVVDAWLRRETPLPTKTTQYCWPSRPATYFVGPGDLRRWELKLLPGEEPEAFSDASRIREILHPYVDVEALEFWRSAAYRFSARVGTKWRTGRVLLAGDAVHQTPPFLGQGLCAGIRDAANLAWKIVHMKRTGLSTSLLDSYETERRPHVASVITHAKEFGLIIGELDPERAIKRDARLRRQMQSGDMVTSRQSFIPDLHAGLIAADESGPPKLAGSLMVQPKVDGPDGHPTLFDDLAPMEFLYVTDGLAPQGWMKGWSRAWESLNGRRIALLPSSAAELVEPPNGVPNGVKVYREVGDLFSSWCRRTATRAVLVRPDRYIYCRISDRQDMEFKLPVLFEKLQPDAI